MKSAHDYGQMFDSFANGGFSKPNQTKPTADPGAQPKKRQIKRLERKRPKSQPRLNVDEAQPSDPPLKE